MPYSKSDEPQHYLLPSDIPSKENPEKNIENKEKTLISSQFDSMTKTPEEIAAEALANAANFKKEADDAKAESANFKKEADEAKAEVSRLQAEATQKATFDKASLEIATFAKKGKVRFSNDADKEIAAKFAATLPDEATRTAFYGILNKLVAFEGNEEEEEGDEAPEGGEQAPAKEGDEPTAAQMKKAEDLADQYMKEEKYSQRWEALSAAYEKLGIAQ